MVWINRAMTSSIRLNSSVGDIHYEITLNRSNNDPKPFEIEVESLSEGKRLGRRTATYDELVKLSPDLKAWETILLAYEQLKVAEMRIYKLENALKEAEHKLHKESSTEEDDEL